jgi:hypothetical protein
MVEVGDMEQRSATILSTKAADQLRPSEVRDRMRAALAANAAELAARRRWATIYRGGRPVASLDPRVRDARVKHLRQKLAAESSAA